MRLSRLASRNAAATAALGERARIARDIHDGIAQTFLAIQMQLETARPENASEAMVAAAQSARRGLQDARRAVAALRPNELLDAPLPEALQRFVGQYAHLGTPRAPTLHVPATWDPLAHDVEEQLFRITQEAVQNAIKHSGGATIRIELVQAIGESSILIADTGPGFDVPNASELRPGFGLDSMRQRAAMIGARLEIQSSVGGGTQVLVSIGNNDGAWAHDRALEFT